MASLAAPAPSDSLSIDLFAERPIKEPGDVALEPGHRVKGLVDVPGLMQDPAQVQGTFRYGVEAPQPG